MIPQDAVGNDVEESARFYEGDDGELHIRSDFPVDDTEGPRNVRVAFIMRTGVLLKLYDADAEYSADTLEGTYDRLEQVSARVLQQDVNDQAAALIRAVRR